MKRKIFSARRLSLATLIATVMFGGSFTPSEANATTYYVAKNGSDSNSCTSAQSISTPKLTIKNGLSCIKAGDTLDIRAGTYAETIDAQVQTIPTGTSWENAPLITGHAGETVTLRPSSNVSWVVGMTQSSIQYVIFKDFVIDATNANNGIKVLNGAHHIRFQGLEVKNAGLGSGVNGGQGIHSGIGSGPAHGQVFLEFLNMKVHDNGDTEQYDHGFYMETANNLIEGCDIYNNAAFGVQLYRQGSTTLPSNTIVRRNYIHNNGRISVRGGIVVSGPNNLIYNNIVVNNKDEGISIGFGIANNNKIFNNTIYGHSYFGIQVRSGMSGNQISNNIVYSNSSDIMNTGSGTTLSSNLTTSPSFVNAAGGDFRLQSSSPAINAGITVSTVPDDYAGITRPSGGAYDIGAYEYTTATILAPASPVDLQVTVQ